MYCTVDWHDEGVGGINNFVWQSLKQDGSGLNTTIESGQQRLHFVFFGL
jgi:hypothetical protein